MIRTIVTALALATITLLGANSAALASTLRMCTGGETGNYFYVGNQIAKHAGQSLSIDVISTRGSVENMDKILAGDCDAAIVQNDALHVYSNTNPRLLPVVERSASLYTEYAHLLCNKQANIADITRLTNQHSVAIGEGTGTAVTWQGFVLVDRERYGAVPTDGRRELRALSAAADGTDVTCALFVSGLGAPLIKNDATALADRLVLVPINDKRFDDAKDARGRPIYSQETISYDTYSALSPRAWNGRQNVRTIGVDAILIVSTAWINANERANEALLRATSAARPDILNRVRSPR